MSTETRIPAERATIFRAGLLSLAALQAALGAYALLAPRSFYDDFPFGRGWVAALPDYSEHLVRDVGGLFLTTGILLGAAGWFLGRRLVAIALIAFLAYSLPHAIFHFFNLEPYATGDVIANVLGLAATVIVPVGLLAMLRTPASPPPPARTGGNGNGRIEGVAESTRNPLVRYAFRQSRKYAGGEVADPMRIYAHNPTVMLGYGIFELASERSKRLPGRLRHLVTLRAAMLCGCEWCLDYGSAISIAEELDAEDLRALPRYAESGRFSETETLALDYATGMSRTPAEISDELFDQLRRRFGAAELVEMTNLIALENYRARFNWAFGLAGQGFSDGAYCLRPEAVAGAGTAWGAGGVAGTSQ